MSTQNKPTQTDEKRNFDSTQPLERIITEIEVEYRSYRNYVIIFD